MKKNKKFDCVKMKWDIQAQLEDEFLNVSESEANRIQEKKIADNPILRDFLLNVKKVEKQNNLTK